MQFLNKYTDVSYALMRIMAGLFFVQHGTQKLFGFPAEFPYPLNPLLILAAIIELVAGLMIAAGFQTRIAAFVASGMSAVGYWMAHGSKGFFPILNGGETIALYCFIFLYIATKGGGKFSIDERV